MAGGISFQIIIRTRNGGLLSAMAAGLSDLSEAFEHMIDNWANHNVEKFQKTLGAQSVGAHMADGVDWEPLTAGYSKAKAKDGYADWLMVRTGTLAQSLSNPDGGFAKFIEPQKATFGVPMDEEASQHAGWNWERRQAIFLDEIDKLDIQKEIHDLMTFGPGYEDAKNRLSYYKDQEEEQVLEA